jgi:hypothetical protein
MLFGEVEHRQTAVLMVGDVTMKTAFTFLGVVLISLCLGACQRDEFAVKILADKSLVGSEVLIDGAKAGALEGKESSGAYFSKWVSREPHRLQIRVDQR